MTGPDDAGHEWVKLEVSLTSNQPKHHKNKNDIHRPPGGLLNTS